MHVLCLVIGLHVFFVHHVVSQTGPNECTYSDGIYTCNYEQMSSSDRPIDFYQFSEQPQQLILQVNGLVPFFGDTKVFTTGFSTTVGMDTSIFDENYPATMIMECGVQGTAYISSGAFYFTEYVEHFKIRNCDILYIGTDTFSAFVELDYLSIEGGSIDDMEMTAMSGLTVEKLAQSTHKFPRRHGRVEVVNTQLAYGIVTPGLLTYFTSVTSIVLKNTGVSYITRDQFDNNQLVTTIDLSDNIFATLPNSVFTDLNALCELTFYNIPWTCSCEDFQWLGKAISNKVTIRGDMMCANINGMSVLKYYHDNCDTDTVCDGATGIQYGDKCVTPLGILVIIFGFLSFFGTCGSLVIAILNCKDLEVYDDPDPILLERLKRRAKQRWLKATRTIIYAKRTGRQLAGVFSESKSSIKTMSIPDETRTRYGGDSRNTFDSSIPDFDTINDSSNYRYNAGNSGSPGSDSYGRMHRMHSLGDVSYADFPNDYGNRYVR